MSVTTAFLMVALGMAIHAAHTVICRKAEQRAYESGFQNARREERIRIAAAEGYRRDADFARIAGRDPYEGKSNEPARVSESLVLSLNEHGRAAARIR